jgi:hypothetical protein
VAGGMSIYIRSDFKNIRRGFTNFEAANTRLNASRSGQGSAYTGPTQRHIMKTECRSIYV